METGTPAAAAPRLAAIALPSEGTLETLPATEREISEIGAFYRHVETLPASRATFAAFVAAASRADVVHIAGHTLRRKGGGDPALVFNGGERVAWNDIAAHFGAHPDVVLLSACETLRRRRMTQTRSLSLGGAFLAAGAADVIGTVAPINDRDALELFRSIHAQLAAGLGAAEALRRAQLDAIASEKSGGTPGGWRTVALLTNRLPAGGRTP
jgi:CHAT domain-containing protein